MNLSRLIIVLMLAVVQLLSGAYATGMVLCIGDNGHMAVELAHADCGPAGERIIEGIADARLMIDSRMMVSALDAPCSDVLLASEQFAAGMRSQLRHNAVLGNTMALLPAFYALTVPDQHLQIKPDKEANLRPDLPLAMRRTVVLTI